MTNKIAFAGLIMIVALAACDKMPWTTVTPAVTHKDEAPKIDVSQIMAPCTTQKPEKQGDKTVMVQGDPGVQHLETKSVNGQQSSARALSHCIPCSKARSKAEKFVCDGEAS